MSLNRVSKVMKAVMVSRFGSPEVLKVVPNLPIPQPGSNEVLINFKAIGVNPVDTYIRAGMFKHDANLPYIPGNDAAGVVEAIGNDVTRFKLGDRVFTSLKIGSNIGCYAEYASISTNVVYPLHDLLTFSQGACLGLPYFTAYRSLFSKANVKSSDSVLIHGASGGVGIATIQLAKNHNCFVIGTAGSEEGLTLLRSQGVNVTASHNQANYHQSILKNCHTEGVDVIIEMLANENLGKDLEMLNFRGKVVIVGSNGSISIMPGITMFKELSLFGVKVDSADDNEVKDAFAYINSAIESGLVRPVVNKEYELEDVQLAHEHITNNAGAKGNVVLIP